MFSICIFVVLIFCYINKKYGAHTVSAFSLLPISRTGLIGILLKFMTRELYWCNDTEAAWSTTEKGSQVGDKNQCTSSILTNPMWKEHQQDNWLIQAVDLYLAPAAHLCYLVMRSLRTGRLFGDHTLNNNFSLLLFFLLLYLFLSCEVLFLPFLFSLHFDFKGSKTSVKIFILLPFTLTNIHLPV